MSLGRAEIALFERGPYDRDREDNALSSRGRFIRAFPADALGRLTIESYSIGIPDSFCYHVEPGTSAWAQVKGATAFKFGVYFGRTKHDARERFRATKKFGDTPAQAFQGVKRALTALVAEGSKRSPDYVAIDDNPLSQMLKAKVLSLYYPDMFINICSADHLRTISDELNVNLSNSTAERQALILGEMERLTPGWSNPKRMQLLYSNYIWEERAASKLRRPRTPPKVDFEKLQAKWREIGRKAELFAMAWDRDRLVALGVTNPDRYIADVTDRPGCGYDFETLQNDRRSPRYAEVKAVSTRGGFVRYYLSAGEERVARSSDHSQSYYFYLVRFLEDEPVEVSVHLASELFDKALLTVSGYVVTFAA